MKTAISMPDETFAQASRQASARGMSRSAFVTEAVQAYLERIDAESLTAGVDEAVALLERDDSASVAVSGGRRRLGHGEDDW